MKLPSTNKCQSHQCYTSSRWRPSLSSPLIFQSPFISQDHAFSWPVWPNKLSCLRRTVFITCSVRCIHLPLSTTSSNPALLTYFENSKATSGMCAVCQAILNNGKSDEYSPNLTTWFSGFTLKYLTISSSSSSSWTLLPRRFCTWASISKQNK